MNTRSMTLGLAAILLLLSAVSVAANEGLADIIVVDRADTIRDISVTGNSSLFNMLNGVTARVAVQFSNTIRHIPLPPLSGELNTRLGQVPARVAVQFSNTIRHSNLVAAPSAFQSLLGQVTERIVFQFANTNREMRLAYPGALVNDRVPPQISAVSSVGVKISWTTDEWATGTVEYGTQPGVYPYKATDPLYAKRHEITLAGLVSGQTYYYRVSSTDRNGNTTTSGQYTLTGRTSVSLPIVLKQR